MLDAHAMLRIGASLAGQVPSGRTAMDLLDKLPGWVGDAQPHAPVGRLVIGADGPLRLRREYQRVNNLSL